MFKYIFSGPPTQQEKVMYLETVRVAKTNSCVIIVAKDQPRQNGLDA